MLVLDRAAKAALVLPCRFAAFILFGEPSYE